MSRRSLFDRELVDFVSVQVGQVGFARDGLSVSGGGAGALQPLFHVAFFAGSDGSTSDFGLSPCDRPRSHPDQQAQQTAPWREHGARMRLARPSCRHQR